MALADRSVAVSRVADGLFHKLGDRLPERLTRAPPVQLRILNFCGALGGILGRTEHSEVGRGLPAELVRQF